jgi:ribosome maturation factor RimP
MRSDNKDAIDQVGAFGTRLNFCVETKPGASVLTEVSDIWTVVEPYLAAERLELDDVELLGRGPGTLLRVVVDGENVDIDRLADVSRGISRLLDSESELDDAYRLEVTSPGLERNLRRPSHYAKSVGREVVVKIAQGDSKTTIRGTLADAGEDSFTVEADRGKTVVSYEDVLTAKTVFRWEKAPKPGH